MSRLWSALRRWFYGEKKCRTTGCYAGAASGLAVCHLCAFDIQILAIDPALVPSESLVMREREAGS